MVTSSREVLSSITENETFKVSELERKFHISVSQKDIDSYGDILLSREEIQKIQEGKNTVSELARFKLDSLKGGLKRGVEQVASDLQRSMGIERQKMQEGAETAARADETFDSLMESGRKVGGKTGEVVQEGARKLSDATKKAAETGYGIQLGAAMKDFVEKIKNFDFLGAIFSFLKGLVGMFSSSEVLRNAGEKVEDALKPEEIEKAKQYLNTELDVILKNFSPEKREQIKTYISDPKNVSEEQLKIILKKAQNGEYISLTNLKDIVPGFNEFIKSNFGPEEIDAMRKEIEERAIEEVKREVQEKYNIELTEGKINDLKELVRKYLRLSDDNITTILDAINKKNLRIKDLYGSIFEAGLNGLGFTAGLIIKGIVPISAFGMEFIETSGEIISLTSSSLGLSEHIDIETFHKGFSEMSPEEKHILVALVYRKGGLFLGLLGRVSETLTRLGVEAITNTSVKSWRLGANAAFGNYKQQIEAFDKISVAMSQAAPEAEAGKKIINEALANLKHVQTNYRILDIIREADGNFDKAKKLFESANLELPKGATDMTSLKTALNDSFEKGFTKGSGQQFKRFSVNNFGFGPSGEIYELNKKFENIVKYQKQVFHGSTLGRLLGKTNEVLDSAKISRLGDKIVFHFNSVDEFKDFGQKFKGLLQKTPELAGAIFDKMPIFMVAGIAANSDKPFFESIQKEFLYLIPMIGPFMLIGESGFNWENGWKIENPIEAGIGGALIGMDTVFLMKELYRNGGPGILRYMGKPLFDLYDIARGTGEGIYSLGKAIASLDKAGFEEVGKRAVEMTKGLKGKVKALAIIAIGGYLLAETAFAEDNELQEYLKKDNTLDYDKVRQQAGVLSENEKNEVVRFLFLSENGEEFTKDVEFKFKGNKIIGIISSNPKVQNESVIVSPSIIEKLGYLFDIEDINFKYNGQL
ncbi:MAG: hypothetical protein PHH06_03185 [Candidatus Gracilibacteria bacterium]|nr:hypothetical protein [Candidatus Gracilibacteria bacterium]